MYLTGKGKKMEVDSGDGQRDIFQEMLKLSIILLVLPVRQLSRTLL